MEGIEGENKEEKLSTKTIWGKKNTPFALKQKEESRKVAMEALKGADSWIILTYKDNDAAGI